MDGASALAELQRQVRNRLTTQADLARDIGVSEPTVSRWLDASEPMKGSSLKKLLAWFERLPARQPSMVRENVSHYDASVAAVIATGENRARLGVVQGYAQFVLDQLLELARKQQQVVDGIKPFAEAEGQALAANVPPEKIPELLESIRRYQAKSSDHESTNSHRGTG